MIFPLTLTAIVLGSSAADSNACTGTALPINLSHQVCRPFQPRRLTQSRRQLSSTGRARKQTAFHSQAPARPRPRPPQSRGHYSIVPNFPRLRSIRLL